MKITPTFLTIAAIYCFAHSAFAQTNFVFANNNTMIGAGLDELTTGSFTVDGTTITATASTDTFNATSSYFGINQAASGDDTDGFDFEQTGGPGVAEGFTLSFNRDVQLASISVSSWGSNDEATLIDGSTTLAIITGTGTTPLNNYLLDSSATLSVMTTAGEYGNGWSFDAITIVPEPNICALLAGTFALVFVMIGRRE